MSDRYYKIVSLSMASCHGGDGAWAIGVERRVAPPLEPCRHGLHVCRIEHLSRWIVGGIVLEVEIAGEIVDERDKIVVESATPVRVVGKLTPRLLREFACDCAERALLRAREAGREPDPRSWAAIEVARRFARGEATIAEARYAAYAAYAAAAAAAAERRWQGERLLAMLGEVTRG
jgi:hypothetical protein